MAAWCGCLPAQHRSRESPAGRGPGAEAASRAQPLPCLWPSFQASLEPGAGCWRHAVAQPSAPGRVSICSHLHLLAELVRVSPAGDVSLGSGGELSAVVLASLNDALNTIGIRVSAPSGEGSVPAGRCCPLLAAAGRCSWRFHVSAPSSELASLRCCRGLAGAAGRGSADRTPLGALLAAAAAGRRVTAVVGCPSPATSFRRPRSGGVVHQRWPLSHALLRRRGERR